LSESALSAQADLPGRRRIVDQRLRPPSVDPYQKTEATENKTMKSALSTADIRQQIPPLDLLQPQEIKTATFALG